MNPVGDFTEVEWCYCDTCMYVWPSLHGEYCPRCQVVNQAEDIKPKWFDLDEPTKFLGKGFLLILLVGVMYAVVVEAFLIN